MISVKILLLLLNEDREKRTTHVSDFISDPAITPTLVVKSSLERFVCLKFFIVDTPCPGVCFTKVFMA